MSTFDMPFKDITNEELYGLYPSQYTEYKDQILYNGCWYECDGNIYFTFDPVDFMLSTYLCFDKDQINKLIDLDGRAKVICKTYPIDLFKLDDYDDQ